MSVRILMDGAQPVQPETTLIPREVHRARLGGISRSTEYQLIKRDPSHPKPVHVTGHFYAYVDAESLAYVAAKVARRGESPPRDPSKVGGGRPGPGRGHKNGGRQ